MSGPSAAPLDPGLAADATEALRALLQMLRVHTETAQHAGTKALRSWRGPYADVYRGSRPAAHREAAALQDQILSLIAQIEAASAPGQT